MNMVNRFWFLKVSYARLLDPQYIDSLFMNKNEKACPFKMFAFYSFNL